MIGITIEKVIEEKPLESSIMFFLFLLIIAAIFMLMLIIKDTTANRVGVMIHFMIVIMYLFFTNPNKVEEWEKDYVYPFSEELPAEKYDLKSYSIDYDTWYISDRLIEQSFLLPNITRNSIAKAEMNYLNDEKMGVNEEEYVIVVYDLEEEETPYYERKYLEKDLSNKIKEGYINRIIHLPVSEFATKGG